MNFRSRLKAALAIFATIPACVAAQQAGLTFSHLDWELACDNTRTCRAAGYYSDGSGENDKLPLLVSVLLTRAAGAHTPVRAELQVRNAEGEEFDADVLRKMALAMSINGSRLGNVVVNANNMTLQLAPEQTAALISALAGSATIEWSNGTSTWKLSDHGAAAVFLKMDEFQGRLGTSGALVRKGVKEESTVRPALPAPVIQAAAVPRARAVQLPKARLAALNAAVRASMQDCSDEETTRPRDALVVHPLSSTKLLVSTACWTGAYNQGFAYWVVNAAPPYAPQLVTTDGTDYDNGKIGAGHKGRGMGDCWSSREWTWDGRRFVLTSESKGGQCKSFSGGAWTLPVLVTTVKPPRG